MAMNENSVCSKEEKGIQLKKKKSISFNRITHLYLQEKKLVEIPALPNAQDVHTLYLYNNTIAKIENLEKLTNLDSLYLQNNEIAKMENLTKLYKLKKLYLGRNKIGVLEGLECIDTLQELYIEKQNLSDCSPLCFDPRTILSLSETLRILNISYNKITTLKFLVPLKHLTMLDASHNDLDDMKDVCQTLRNWIFLEEAKLIGNPISKNHWYREDIIANTYRLEILDGKNISTLSRNFIKKFKDRKLINAPKQDLNIPDILPALARNYPTALQKVASASLMKDIKCQKLDDIAVFSDTQPVYLPWNILPTRRSLTKPANYSLLRGHKMESQKSIVVSKSTIKIKRQS